MFSEDGSKIVYNACENDNMLNPIHIGGNDHGSTPVILTTIGLFHLRSL